LSTISVEEYFNYDFSFSKDWDNNITTEIDICRPDQADLRELCEKPTSIGFFPTPDSLDESVPPPHSDDEKELIQTQILQDLNEAIDEAKEDRKNIRYKPITDDILIIQQWEENKEEYRKVRIYQHAEEICTHIEGLIQLDDYPENKFGNFDKIREQIFRQNDDIMADRLLGQLLIIGKSAIPAEIKTTQVQVIEQSMGGSTVPTQEQR